MHVSVEEALRALHAHEDTRFLEIYRHGSLSVEIYEPKIRDPQQPHEKDELYIIISGHGTFQHGDQQRPFQPGDLLFVPAGDEHRFIEFSDDFKTWVIFYGPPGGEAELIP